MSLKPSAWEFSDLHSVNKNSLKTKLPDGKEREEMYCTILSGLKSSVFVPIDDLQNCASRPDMKEYIKNTQKLIETLESSNNIPSTTKKEHTIYNIDVYDEKLDKRTAILTAIENLVSFDYLLLNAAKLTDDWRDYDDDNIETIDIIVDKKAWSNWKVIRNMLINNK